MMMMDDNQGDAGRRRVVITELTGCLLHTYHQCYCTCIPIFRSLVRLSNSTQIIEMSSWFNNTSIREVSSYLLASGIFATSVLSEITFFFRIPRRLSEGNTQVRDRRWHCLYVS